MVTDGGPARLSVDWETMARTVWVAGALLAGSATLSGAESGGRANFNFDIRPVLSDRCFKCHGPDERARQAGLRLDQEESALAPRTDGRTPVRPGDRKGSELWRRITASDPDERMPPPDSNLSLTAGEIETLGRWIDEGARFERHWAFAPPAAPPLPEPRRDPRMGPARNPIDLFILERLEREGLEPAPEASRETLIRRLSLDLTGLPPTVTEIDAFLADASPDAYERLVERLLASSAYGEARALEWLDLARYADTYGYQADVDRDMSPWRDWVIRTFNDNLPLDDFITWQIAGDLLSGATRDQVLATAFLRLHRQTNEGGSIEEEFRTEYAADRVHTVGTAFLGLTLECARCHDHKYDPIPQRDYYGLFAFFDNIDESGLYSHFTRATPTPTMLLYPDGMEAKHAALRTSLEERRQALAKAEAAAADRFDAWLLAGPRTVAPPRPADRYALDEVSGDTSPNDADPARPARLVDGPATVEGKRGGALRFSGDNSAVLAGAGAFRRTSPFALSLWIRPESKQTRAVLVHRSRAWTDSGSRGYELLLDEGRPEFSLIHFWPGNAASIRARAPVPPGKWTHITAAHDGSGRASGLRIFIDGDLAPAEVIRDRLEKDIIHRGEWGDSDVGAIELTLGARFRDSGFKDGTIDEVAVFAHDLSAAEARLLAGGSLDAASADDRPLLLDHFVRRVDTACAAAHEAARKVQEEEARLADDVPEIMVMREMEPRRPTHVLHRGAYDAPRELVEPAAPSSIYAFDPELPRNRLGLARWLVHPRNPLTARVAANRAWTVCFGRGLVATPEDFGSQGRLPSYPELLDWLSTRLVSGGWDLKALFRTIVGSAAYRRSSAASEESLQRDPDNVLLSRGPRIRLRAEAIRDSALLASGLLSRRMGGPSVKPYQPAGLWEEAGTGKSYVQDKGEALHRRSLYTFWRRTAPPPSMVVFDAPSREVCCARRDPTGTPLQSLVLLNDPQFVEAGRVLAERLVKEHPDDPGRRIEQAFRALAGRRPEADERQVLERLLAEERARLSGDPETAEKRLHAGEHPRDDSVPAVEAAATASVVGAILALDEFVNRR